MTLAIGFWGKVNKVTWEKPGDRFFFSVTLAIGFWGKVNKVTWKKPGDRFFPVTLAIGFWGKVNTVTWTKPGDRFFPVTLAIGFWGKVNKVTWEKPGDRFFPVTLAIGFWGKVNKVTWKKPGDRFFPVTLAIGFWGKVNKVTWKKPGDRFFPVTLAIGFWGKVNKVTWKKPGDRFFPVTLAIGFWGKVNKVTWKKPGDSTWGSRQLPHFQPGFFSWISGWVAFGTSGALASDVSAERSERFLCPAALARASVGLRIGPQSLKKPRKKANVSNQVGLAGCFWVGSVPSLVLGKHKAPSGGHLTHFQPMADLNGLGMAGLGPMGLAQNTWRFPGVRFWVLKLVKGAWVSA